MLQSLIDENERSSRLFVGAIKAQRAGDLRTYMKEHLNNVRIQFEKVRVDDSRADDLGQPQEGDGELGEDAT